MKIETSQEFTGVLLQVQKWPFETQLAFATKILESLHRETETRPASYEQRTAIKKLIGIWKHVSPPGDEGVREIVEQERMKKYGS